MADSCKHGDEPLGSIKCVESLLRARPLLTSQGGYSEQRSWISITASEEDGACSVHG